MWATVGNKSHPNINSIFCCVSLGEPTVKHENHKATSERVADIDGLVDDASTRRVFGGRSAHLREGNIIDLLRESRLEIHVMSAAVIWRSCLMHNTSEVYTRWQHEETAGRRQADNPVRQMRALVSLPQ